MQHDLLFRPCVVQALESPKLAGDLSRFKMEAAGEELVAGRFEVRAEELQLIIELEDAPVGFVVASDLSSDLPVVQFGRGSQDNVEGGGGSANAAEEPRGGQVRNVVWVHSGGGKDLGGVDEGVFASIGSPSSIGDSIVAFNEVGLGRQPILGWD